jgi:putative MFS transporter
VGGAKLEQTALRPLHLRVVVGGSGGQFSDGYILGIVGITITSASTELSLTPLWIALLGAASLAGLFVGALASGPFVDRYGRAPVFAWDMPVFCILSAVQFFVASAPQMLVLRVLLGITLGADYVTAKALVMEYCPHRHRGRLLSILAVAWAAGYGVAYCVGFTLRGLGPNAWRWMLLSSAIPAALVSPLRLRMPESPLWSERSTSASRHGAWTMLFSQGMRRRSLVACLFYTCQVIPFFAVSTFIPRLLTALNVRNGYSGGLVYSVFLLAGACLGLAVVDSLPRRLFLVSSFYACALVLITLTLWSHLPASAAVGLFAIFSAILAAAANLEYVYTPELFPTELRGSGVGIAVAASRVGAAASTFLLPLVETQFGVRAALTGCVAVLLLGGLGCQLWAPETREFRTN